MSDPDKEQPTHQDLMNKLDQIQTTVVADQPNKFTKLVQKYWWIFMGASAIIGVFTHKWGLFKYLFSVFA